MDVNLPIYSPGEDKKVAERIFSTSIDGLFFIDTPLSKDSRGFFREVALLPDLASLLPFEFNIAQINHANSVKNVIRGFHAEDWNKLVTVTHGKALCVLVDIRPNSPTYLKKEHFMLGLEDQATPGSIFITKGIANSVLALSSEIDYLYFVDALYRDRDTSGDTAISLFDETIGVSWPIPKEEMIISERDLQAVPLKDLTK